MPTWRVLFGASAALLMVGCSALLNLDELQKADCVGADCSGGGQTSGSGGQGSNVGGSHAQAGTTQTPVAGRGGNASTAGTGGIGNTGDSGSADGGDNGDRGGSSNGGSGVTAGSGGTDVGGGNGGSGVAGGSGGSAGSQTGGTAGQSGAGGCQPSAVNQWCDGLDAACNVTNADTACLATCKGAFVQGSVYMSCLSASDFDSAEAQCQANGMHLVKIDSAGENKIVLGLAADDYVWVGGSNRENADVFRWTDGTAFYSFSTTVSGYKNFVAGDPDPSTDLRCVQLMVPYAGTWSNWYCSEAQSFVCERY